jgi:carboxypeptidase C (cathepsin A)
MKLYRRKLPGFTISFAIVLATSAFAELPLTSLQFTVKAQHTAANQVAAGEERALDKWTAVEEQITSRENQIVTTKHQVVVAGRVLKYTARAGRLPILVVENGQVHAWMFFTSYTLDSPRRPEKRLGCCGSADQPPGSSQRPPLRPLMFLWKGGPGANSTLLHLSGFGPKRLKSNGDPTAAAAGCECEIEDNQTTWLDRTDLVFVDPIGTGFSRPTKAEYADEFYSTLGDIASVAEFIRVYRTRFDAWDSPLFIAGESYGVWRAAGVMESLERRGQKVAGVMLISGGIPVGPVLSDEMRAAMFVPTHTAASLFHKKLTPELQKDAAGTLQTEPH